MWPQQAGLLLAWYGCDDFRLSGLVRILFLRYPKYDDSMHKYNSVAPCVPQLYIAPAKPALGCLLGSFPAHLAMLHDRLSMSPCQYLNTLMPQLSTK